MLPGTRLYDSQLLRTVASWEKNWTLSIWGGKPCVLKYWTDMKGNLIYQVEPAHDKTNKMTCAPSEDSDQPGHLPSLIRQILRCLHEGFWVLSFPKSAQRRRWSDCTNVVYDLSRARQNLQNVLCTWWRLRAACAVTQSDQCLLGTQWLAKDPKLLHAYSKDSYHTASQGAHVISCSGSFVSMTETHIFVEFIDQDYSVLQFQTRHEREILLPLAKWKKVHCRYKGVESTSMIIILSFGQTGLGKQCRL